MIRVAGSPQGNRARYRRRGRTPPAVPRRHRRRAVCALLPRAGPARSRLRPTAARPEVTVRSARPCRRQRQSSRARWSRAGSVLGASGRPMRPGRRPQPPQRVRRDIVRDGDDHFVRDHRQFAHRSEGGLGEEEIHPPTLRISADAIHARYESGLGAAGVNACPTPTP